MKRRILLTPRALYLLVTVCNEYQFTIAEYTP